MLAGMSSSAPVSIAEALNADCHCVVVDEALLDAALAQQSLGLGVEELQASHPHLFSRAGVFVDAHQLRVMRDVIAAVERIVALPGYEALALSDAPLHAKIPTRALGAFLGYDFHLSARGPQLIEINTNPGGALLCATLRQAQRACCDEVAVALKLARDDPSAAFVEMFRSEYALVQGTRPLEQVVIVDDAPEQQYLYPEFVLFERLLRRHGIRAHIADPSALSIRDDRLTFQGEPVDLVYNRLTDFALEQPAHAALGEAYRRGLAVVTPHPRAHALFADKRRLVTLSDAEALHSLGASQEDVALVTQHVPRTIVVDPSLREQLWAERKSLFFKPQSGYGSKAAYRGDKITKTVFEQLFEAPYVAQSLVPPTSRSICVGDEKRELKLDVRNYAYRGQTMLVAARLYQGQTTNFRTQGGGFAPVYETAT